MLRAYIVLDHNVEGDQFPEIYLLENLLILISHRSAVFRGGSLEIDAYRLQLFLDNILQTGTQRLNDSLL